MEISNVPIIDFYKYCLDGARDRGFHWVISLVARDADVADLYQNTISSWRSLNSLTGKHFLFVFAGAKGNASADETNTVYDTNLGWRGVTNQFVSILNHHIRLSTLVPHKQKHGRNYVPYDWAHDKKGYLKTLSENQTDAVASLKRYFHLSESDIPCLVFTSLHSKHSYIVQLSRHANDLYSYFKSLFSSIESHLFEIEYLDNKLTSLQHQKTQLNKKSTQLNNQPKCIEEKLYALYQELTAYADSNGDHDLRLHIEQRRYMTIPQPFRAKLSKYVDLAKEYERQKQVTFDIDCIIASATHVLTDKAAVNDERDAVLMQLDSASQARNRLLKQVDATIKSTPTTHIQENCPANASPIRGRDDYLNSIEKSLAYMASRLDINNPNNRTDLNIALEQSMCGLLNIVFGWQLVNLNSQTINIPAIDLADSTLGISVQVSSDASPEKVRLTLNTFFTNNLQEKYRELHIVFLKPYTSRIKDFSKNLVGDYAFSFESNVWDTTRLFSHISSIPDTSKLQVIANYLAAEIGYLPEFHI